MPPSFRPLDKDGFPIPPSFDEPQGQDEFRPLSSPSASPHRDDLVLDGGPGSPPHKRSRWKLWVALIVVAAIALPETYRFGRRSVANWLLDRAAQKMEREDYVGAESDLSWAISWQDDNLELYFTRAECREQLRNLDGSLEDFTEVVLLEPKLAPAYMKRSWIYSRKGDNRRAIDDANRSVLLVEGREDNALNHRAYVRALAGMELSEALDDVQRALSVEPRNANYLDTRGYIYHLLGDQTKALKDLEDSLRLTERDRDRVLLRVQQFAPGRLPRYERHFNENLAVIYQHLALVEQKLDQKEKASQYFAKSKQLGYDPEAGVR